MKKEKGVTLISLVVYIILMTFVIAGVSSITTSFYTNITQFNDTSKSAVEYAKLNMYILNDIKSKDVRIAQTNGTNGFTLSLLSNVQPISEQVTYELKGDAIYRNNVKICEGITEGSILSNVNGKTIIVSIKMKNYEKTSSYAVEPKIL